MEDARTANGNSTSSARPGRFVPSQSLILGLGLVLLAGCAPIILMGKMFFGDPSVPGAFQQATGVDLTEGKHKVIVLCSAPSMVDNGDLSLNYEIVENFSRRLKREGIRLIESNDVRTWMDDNGGQLNDPRDLAEEFDVDFIIYVALARATFREENSPTLYRGQASGEVFAYEVRKTKGEVLVNEVFSKGFGSTYPDFHPVSADQIDSPRIFQKRFLDRVSAQLAHLFYKHKVSEEIR